MIPRLSEVIRAQVYRECAPCERLFDESGDVDESACPCCKKPAPVVTVRTVEVKDGA